MNRPSGRNANAEKLSELNSHPSYREHFRLSAPPFNQGPDPEQFFGDGGREELLGRLLSDIEEGKRLIRLTGGEGVGKTLFQQLLAERLPRARFDPVRLDHPVGSFEDLLRLICLALGRKTEGEAAAPASFLAEFKEQLLDRKARGIRVVLLIDDAEKLFLATLERLVRLTCDGDVEDALQILLIGRPELNRNIEQLAVYCAGIDLDVHYDLEPLTRTETERYIRHRLALAGCPADRAAIIFTAEAITAMHQAAGGNIGLIGMLADKGLTAAYEMGKDKVAADALFPRLQEAGNNRSGFALVREWLQKYRLWLLPALAFVLILLLLPLRPDDRETEAPAPPVEKPEPAVEAPPPVEPAETAVKEKPSPAEAESTAGGKEPAAARQHEQLNESAPQQEPLGTDRVSMEEKKKEAEPQRQPAAAEQAGKGSGGKPAPRAAASPAAEAAPSGPPAPPKEIVVLQPAAKKRDGAPQPPAIVALQPAAARNPHEIFQERTRATSNWLAWSYRGGYTIQLMMLGSDSAEENLKRLLVRDDYYSVKDDLYILRKTSSPTLLVFYGLYDTMEQARRVRNNLPGFLLSHQPYALSIKDALEKTGE